MNNLKKNCEEQTMKLHYVHRKYVSHVELQKEGTTSLGLVVKGGTKYGLRPVIKTVKKGSIAYRSHCVSTQDVIVSICGLDTKGMKKKDVRRLLKETESLIELKLEYEIQDTCFSKFGIYRPERMSLKLKKESDSFGFVLRKSCLTHASSSGYPVFSNIKEGSPVDRGNVLKAGDRLIQIDEQNVEWLSLLEVADILKEKDEATFLIEYNIAVVGASCLRKGERTCLEIACPDTDLGVVLGHSRSKMIIEDIRKGSLAERCGALHVGDEILAINEIDADFLTPSKANILLHNFKKDSGKLIFIPHMEESRQEILERRRKSKMINRSLHHSITEEDQMVPPSIESFTSEGQESSDKSNSDNDDSSILESIRHFYDFQMENICLLREVVENATQLQHFMEFFVHDGTYIQRETSNVSEMINKHEQNFAKIEFGKLTRLKDLCSRTKNSARSITMHLVRNGDIFWYRHGGSICGKVKSFNSSCSGGDYDFASKNHPVRELIKNLIEIRLRKVISKSNLEVITSKFCRIGLNCRECYGMCMSAVFKTQKMLLILSLDDKSADIWLATNKLVNDISTMKIPCSDCKTLQYSITQAGLESVRNNAFSSLLHRKSDAYKFTWKSDKKSSHSNSQTDSASPKIAENTTNESNAGNLSKCDERQYHISLNTAEQSAFYIQKQTPSPELQRRDSIVDSSSSLPSLRVPNNSPSSSSNLQSSENVSDQEVNFSDNYNYNIQNKIHKGKSLSKIAKENCKSAEVISVVKQENCFSVSKHSSIPNHLDKNYQSTSERFADCANSSESTSLKRDQTQFIETTRDNLNMTSSTNGITFTMSDIANVQNNIERLSDKSNLYFFSYSKQANISGNLKMQVDMVEVKLKNEGKGYGLVIGFLSPPSEDVPRVPRITAVSAQGAAYKIGTLLKGDRVRAINGRNITGLTANRLERLTDEAFRADQVTLTIEFDVIERDMKYGTFDVCISKTSKIGLVFHEFSANSPMVVKGIVKGSAAHRSGLLFPGDEILHTICLRQESYDVLGGTYEKTDAVVMTVKRDFLQEKQDEGSSSNLNSESFGELPSITPASNTFSLTRTSVHSDHETNSTVLEHELTLFRDPNSGDFGFLIQQNITTGEVYVSDIKPGGPADCSRVIKKNDRILEVNGVNLRYNKDPFVLSLFLQAEDFMKLKTCRKLH